jgi:acyl dehydratase
VDAAEVEAFARRYDPQPFHLDAAAARESVFGALTASGWHTAAITMRLQVDGGLPVAGGIVGVGAELSWPSPVRPGDVLHVETEVLEVRPSRSRPDRGVVSVLSETRTDDGRVVQTLQATLVVPRRPAGRGSLG